MTMRASVRLSLLALWIVALALLGYLAQQRLQIGTDLRLFLPSPTTPQERLLLDEIGEGAGSRVLVLALSGASPEELADASREIAAAMAGNPRFRFVANGELALDALPESLLPYRYLLSDTLDTHTFDAKYLRAEMQARARDLASPAGAFLEPWLPRDPTLELLNVAQRWQPAQEPNRLYDVWFDRAGERALLLAETVAPAFDSDAQRAAIEALREAHAAIDPQHRYTLTISGTGQFTVLMEQRTRGEAQTLGMAATIGMILLVLVAYRRVSTIFFSALPLATAGLVGLSAVSLIFGEVHGITLAFGFTLIGVAQDYPIHVLSHWRAERPTLGIVRELWPTLATGVASTCIAYLTFLFSGVIGLRQLACFTIAGLAAASLTTRFLLPRLMGVGTRDYGESRALHALSTSIDALPRFRWIPVVLSIGSIVAIASSKTPLWEDDLSRLTPVPTELLIQDQTLRGALGAADVRYLLVVNASEVQQALERLEDLSQSLSALVKRGAITGFDHAARYVPSVRTQRARQQALPDTQQLREALQRALSGMPFRAGVFDPFVADVARAKTLAPLTPEDLRETTLGANLDMLFAQDRNETRTFVTLNGVRDARALRELEQAHPGVMLLDLKGASESLVAKQRTHILWSLAVASLLLIGVVTFALRKATRVYRVLAPMALTTLVVLAALQLGGTSLNLFHLIALMLAAGLGLDYALFFEHAAHDPLEQRRTLHAVIVCSLSTLFVFALLATSTIPVLQAIGVTVSLGVVSNFLLALMLTRESTRSWPGRVDSGQ
jgi:predicted exporter